MMNFSRIHKFMFDDDILLLDVESGSVHLIDGITSELLDAAKEESSEDFSFEAAIAALSKKYDKEILKSIAEELAALTEEGVLFSAPEPVSDKLPPTWLKSICLNISHDCDLRCRYCFAGTGSFGGERLHMSWEVAKAALDMLLDASGPRPFCEVDFFGGEPLLNFEVVKKAVEYGKTAAAQKNKKIKFTLTTNANALGPEIIDWLNKEGLAVVLSHDGRPEVHDYMRRQKNGQGSHEAVNRNIGAMIESRRSNPFGNYYLRGTYTANNLDFCEDVRYWLEQGYRELSLEPAVTLEPVGWAIREEHLPALKAEYHRLARFYNEKRSQGQSFTFFHFNIDLQKGPCLPKRLWGCGAGYEYLAVTPAGELYPCHQFVGREGFILGNVWERTLNKELSESFKQAHVENKSACRDCWAKYYCSGGCHANAHAANNNLLEPYSLGCELQKYRLECAIWLYVQSLFEQQEN